MADNDYAEHVAGIRQMEEERARGMARTNFPRSARQAERSGQVVPQSTGRGGAGRRTDIGNIGRGLTDFVRRSDRAFSDEHDRNLLRQVSLLGVDPRSAEGQQILDLLLMQVPVNSPDIKALVDEYQSKLIGPQSRRTTAPGVVQGPFSNQYGYTAGDEFTQLDGLSTEYLARTQERMAALGMLDGYIPGRKDQKTVKAFGDLLWMANGEGASWVVMLSDLERQKEEMGEDWEWNSGGSGSGSGGRQPFVAPTYLAPDYATLAQNVKQQMRQALGRDPDESEMAILTAELAGWDREAFDADVAAQRADYDAAETGRETSPTAQAVDPLARFKESFEKRFSGRIEAAEDMRQATEAQETVQGGTSLLSRMSGGMG